MFDPPKIFPLGDGAVTVDFGNDISVELNERSIALASRLERERFPGFIEAVPAFASVAVFYCVSQVRRHLPDFETAFDAVRNHILNELEDTPDASHTPEGIIEIATDFGRESAIDIDIISAYAGLSAEATIEIFISRTYRVFMLGFLPGFAYMGEVDERIAVPRRDTPRRRVPRGSVGIAARQTGIYPHESPGGWQIIGCTDVALFSPERTPPSLLKPGDRVKFVRQSR